MPDLLKGTPALARCPTRVPQSDRGHCQGFHYAQQRFNLASVGNRFRSVAAMANDL
jgi:hypothetical protein